MGDLGFTGLLDEEVDKATKPVCRNLMRGGSLQEFVGVVRVPGRDELDES